MVTDRKGFIMVAFDFWIWTLKSGFRIFQSNARSENGFHFGEICSHGGIQLRNSNLDFMPPFYRSIGKSQKVFAKLFS